MREKLEGKNMEIKKAEIDKGQAFDFGRTSEIYAQYRDIYLECMFQKLADLGLGVEGQKTLILKKAALMLLRLLNASGILNHQS